MSDEQRQDKWGDPISKERWSELLGLLAAWDVPGADHGERKGPFEGVKLTGAEVFWLAEHSERDQDGLVPVLHLAGASLTGAHLERVNLLGAYLERANLTAAYLERANLTGAHLAEATMVRANLEGTNLRLAHLDRANLSGAWLDSKTVLNDTTLDSRTRLGDIHWSGVGAVNLTQLNWEQVPTLGDEQGVDWRSDASKHVAVVRAYRQLAAQLRAQGLSEVADRFALRAQIRQRRMFYKQRRISQWLGSWVIAALAGYGFKPGRTILWYLGILSVFAFLYLHFGSVDKHAFNPIEAAVFSVTSHSWHFIRLSW
jgi:Pentapeptide repeats (8 copies)